MNPFGQPTEIPPLGTYNSQQMLQIAGNSQVPLAQLREMAQAQTYMQEAAMQTHIEIPKVNFYPSNHGNMKKARRADIRQAYRLLTPTKRRLWAPRRWWFGGKYQYAGDATHCCIDGCDVDNLMRAAGNVYEMIKDEESGKSLWELYFTDPVSGEPRGFQAREGVTSGRVIRGTYCPEHLHLYHLLLKWETAEQEEEDGTTSTLKSRLNKGVSMVTVPVAGMTGGMIGKDNTPLPLQKYQPFFNMLKQDNIPVVRLQNSDGNNDLTVVVFDMRQFDTGVNSRQINDAIMTSVAQSGGTGTATMGLGELLAQTAPQTENSNVPPPTQEMMDTAEAMQGVVE